MSEHDVQVIVPQSPRFRVNARDWKSVAITFGIYIASAAIGAATDFIINQFNPNYVEPTARNQIILAISGAVLFGLKLLQKYLQGLPQDVVDEVNFGGAPPKGYTFDSAIKKL